MTGVLLVGALKNYYSVTAFGSKELIDNNQIVPVSESEICGDVMVCSYGDLNDVQVFREFGLKEIVAIDQYGKIGENGITIIDLHLNNINSKHYVGWFINLNNEVLDRFEKSDSQVLKIKILYSVLTHGI